ncbi:nucleolar and coiled-body phosphoprotein 1-like [Centroberyx affinis]|uniref:nucleolar and coiled-body phosphoprotein 1-like n=1 Tax=Centroberyx affinis TaxID=166261 RepID=UPI003A5BE5F6
MKSLSPKLDIDMDSPFKEHRPMKTSSPIATSWNMDLEEQDYEKDRTVSPILFACEDDVQEELKTVPLPIQKPQCNGQITQESGDAELESPPNKFALSKSKTSTHTKKEALSCKETDPVTEKTPNKCQTPDLEAPQKTPKQGSTDPPVPAVRQETQHSAHEKKSESTNRQLPVEMCTSVGKNMTAFLQKLRDVEQPKRACPMKSLSLVKEPTPPEPEDDFLILEDATPLWFSIPSKKGHSKSISRQRQSKTSSTDEERSVDKGTKDSQPEKAGRSKMPSKETKAADKAEDQPKDSATSESVKGKSTLKKEKKAPKSSEVRRSESIKNSKENAKKSQVKSLKGTRERIQVSDAVKETLSVETLKEQNQEQSSEEHGGAVDPYSPGQQAEQNFGPAKEIIKPEAKRKVISKDPANGKAKQTKPSAGEGSSSEDNQGLGRRKRNKPGEWWLNCSLSAEETKVTDPPVVKKSKQNHKKPRAKEPLPIKARKEEDLEERNQKQSAPSPSETAMRKTEKKKARLTKKRTKRRETPHESTPTDKEFNDDQEEQHQFPDRDLDPGLLSPVALLHREHSLAAGERIFDRIYHHTPNKKMPGTPAPISPQRTLPKEHVKTLVPERRRRKPTSSWWKVNELSEDVESISSQPQNPNPKSPKTPKGRGTQPKRRKSPALGSPKNGNMAVSPKPQGGAPEPLPKEKPLSASKTVKRSSATFKDIFTSGAEIPAAASGRDTRQKSSRKMFSVQEEQSVQSSNVTGCPAEEPVQVPATDHIKLNKTDSASVAMYGAESRKRRSWPSNHEILQDSHSDSMLSLRSGPYSMIKLDHYEENEDCTLPSSRDVHPVLSESELCGPPLRPLVLQVKDKANLTEWFKSLWPVMIDNGSEMTPDHFNWYFYQGRALGFHMDLHCRSFCNGKILLGSYMKKPLWVDHNATTVFNVLTSCVNMTINGKESHFNPGQSFMVPHGHAYSIQNLTEEPAVLYFNRMLAGSPD